MVSKFAKLEKVGLLLSLAILIGVLVGKSILGVQDIGILVIMGFLNILVYVIFLVASMFPATWRMTDKQKVQIKDIDKYQSNYRKIFVAITICLSITFSVLTVVVC